MDDAPIPSLRPVEVLPVTQGGQQFFLLRDPLGVACEAALLTPATVGLLAFLDGKHTVRDVQVALTRATGRIVPAAEIESFISDLDRRLLLDSPSYHERRREMAAEYAAWPARPAQFAGRSYSADRATLLDELAAFYRQAEGCAWPPARVSQPPAGIAAPHIDPARGGQVFAQAYAPLWGSAPRTIAILGILHGSARQPFIVSTKDYATPLGIARADRERIAQLRVRLAWDPLEEEDLHRWEHSIEFQVLFLQHALSAGATHAPASDPGYLPILCNFSWEALPPAHSPTAERTQIDSFLDALGDVLEHAPQPCLIVAGVDLAHVGPRFGDPWPITHQLAEELAARDRATLARLAAGDRDGFVAEITHERNQRRICGFAGLYSLLTLLEGIPGEVHGYGQSLDETGGLVSFGALAFQVK